jgi:hypothetical protein
MSETQSVAEGQAEGRNTDVINSISGHSHGGHKDEKEKRQFVQIIILITIRYSVYGN